MEKLRFWTLLPDPQNLYIFPTCKGLSRYPSFIRWYRRRKTLTRKKKFDINFKTSRALNMCLKWIQPTRSSRFTDKLFLFVRQVTCRLWAQHVHRQGRNVPLNRPFWIECEGKNSYMIKRKIRPRKDSRLQNKWHAVVSASHSVTFSCLDIHGILSKKKKSMELIPFLNSI